MTNILNANNLKPANVNNKQYITKIIDTNTINVINAAFNFLEQPQYTQQIVQSPKIRTNKITIEDNEDRITRLQDFKKYLAKEYFFKYYQINHKKYYLTNKLAIMSSNKIEPNLNTNHNKPRKNNLNKIIGKLAYVIEETIRASYSHPKEPSKYIWKFH